MDNQFSRTELLINKEGIEKLKNLRNKTGLEEAVKCGTGKINGNDAVICIMESSFFMGSMGTVVGEKITYSIEQAIKLKIPLIIFSVSGGARMQEGIVSLMQMAKTSSAVAKLNEAGVLYISVFRLLVINAFNSLVSISVSISFNLKYFFAFFILFFVLIFKGYLMDSLLLYFNLE